MRWGTGCGWSAERCPQGQAHSSSPTGTTPGTRGPSASSMGQLPTGPAKTWGLGSDGSSMTDCCPLAMTGAQNQCQDSVATRGASHRCVKSHTWSHSAQATWFLKAKEYGLTFLEKLGQTQPLGQLAHTASEQMLLPSAHRHLGGVLAVPGSPSGPTSQSAEHPPTTRKRRHLFKF